MPPAVSTKEYYRINLAVPFLDHILAQIQERFSAVTIKATQLLALVPSVIQQMQVTAKDLDEALNLYRDDLPSPQLFPAEFRRWKARTEASKQDVANSCASALKSCDSDEFPNIFLLLKIAATLPVTTCECERSFSTMKRLNNYMRCTMGESRLSSLALMHIKYDMPIDLDEVVEVFACLHPRLMELSNLIFK